jgi:O-antigen/teichoic acid export membrane protein
MARTSDRQPPHSEPPSPLRSVLSFVRGELAARRAFVVSGLSSLVLRLAGMVSAFALGVILARVLGPRDFGVYGLVTTVSLFAVTIVQLGTPQLAVREISVRSAKQDWSGVKTILVRFGMATSLASVVLIAVALGAAWLGGASPSDARYVLQGALLTGFVSLTALCAAELRGLGALNKGQVMDIVIRPGFSFLLVLAVLLTHYRLSASVALWIQIAVAAVTTAISLVWLRNALPAEARSAPLDPDYRWVRFALPLGAVDVLRQLDGTYGVVLMGWAASAVDLGVYRVAIGAAVLATMPLTILHVVLAPTVSRLFQFRETQELQRLLRWSSGLMVALLVPMLIILLLFGRPLVTFVFGPAYAGSTMPLVLLCAAQLAAGFFGMGPILLAMCDSERHLTLIYLVAVGLGAACAVPLIWQFGAAGAASAQIISTGLIAALSARFARRKLGLSATFLR